MDFKLCHYIHRVHPNKSPLKIFEKRDRGRIQGLPNFGVPPIISETGKATTFIFGRYIYRVYGVTVQRHNWRVQYIAPTDDQK